jgi:hypothetical protein
MAPVGESVVIDARFNGPPGSGHGGYVCGVLAGFVGPAATVTLRQPPPLGRALGVRRLPDGGAELRDGETLIAEAAPATLEPRVPAAVPFDQAVIAARGYVGFQSHLYPTCFACGPERAEGDGLRIFPGAVPATDLVAAPWVPDAGLGDRAGRVRPEFVWAALDCPSGFAAMRRPGEPILLGRLTASLLAPVTAGERCVLIGWPAEEDGRKLYAGSALLSAGGEVRAAATAVWIRRA